MDNMDNRIFVLLVARILSGEASEKDNKELLQFFEEDNLYKQKFELFKAHWEDKNNIRTDINAALEKIMLRIEKDKGKDEKKIIPMSGKRSVIINFLKAFSKVAAILILCIGCVYFIYQKAKPNIYSRQLSHKETDWRIKQTQKGARSTIILADGTKVILNADSRLRFPQNFSGDKREVYLTGEAFFKVTHNANMPFIIHTDKMNIKVLGTEFNVKSYPEDSSYETTLINGSIEVTLKDRPADRIILKPKEKLIVANLLPEETIPHQESSSPLYPQLSVTNLHYISKTDNDVVETSWVNNKLVFQDQSFGNLAIDMARKYAIHIQFSNEDIKRYRFTGIFEKETVKEALNALQLTEKFNYRIVDSTVYIFNH